MFRHVLLNLVGLGALGLTFVDVGYALSWIGGMSVFTALLYLPSLRKLRTLRRERDQLLERKGEVVGQGNDVLLTPLSRTGPLIRFRG